jgi:calcium channel MID1
MDETDAPPLLSRTPAAPRSPSLALAGVQPAYDYSELPPCLGLCYHADRLCPVFLSFRCPIATGGRDGRGTARRSYAVGSGPMGIAESREKEGVDRFGVAWCERGGEWAS